jgi:hypothetical protein
MEAVSGSLEWGPRGGGESDIWVTRTDGGGTLGVLREITGDNRRASVLGAEPSIRCNEDCGRDIESAPWYYLFQGDRIKDHHLTLVETRAGREQAR